jgi:hypothetical protein
LRAEFEGRVGKKLPKTLSGTRMAVESWARTAPVEPVAKEPNESDYIQSKIDWGLDNLPFGEKAKVQSKEGQYRTTIALDAAGIQFNRALKMLEGEIPFPTKKVFQKGVEDNFYYKGAEALQKVGRELAILGLDTKAAKFPTVDQFKTARGF